MKENKVLIIGGTGFVGQCLTNLLREQGYKNVVPVSRSLNDVDVLKKETMISFVRDADFIVNVSGFISFFRKDREKLREVNNLGVLNILELCEEHGNTKKLIHLSSTASFGFHDDVVSEETIFNWKKHKYLNYSHSKSLPGPRIQESSVNTNIVYPPLIIGAHHSNVTAKMFSYIDENKYIFVPPGKNSYIDIRDLCNAIIRIMESAENKENYIVSNESVSFLELFSTIAGILGQKKKFMKIPKFLEKPAVHISKMLEFAGLPVPSENVFFGFKKRMYDSTKIQKQLGFVPKHKYEQTFLDAIDNWRKNK